jgi:hypothetical protein
MTSARSCPARLDLRLRDDHRFFVARDFRFGLDDVDLRHGADFDARLVVLERRARDVERLLRDVETRIAPTAGSTRAHVARGLDDALLQLDVGLRGLVLAGQQLLPERVDLEVPQQRLVIAAFRPEPSCGLKNGLIAFGRVARPVNGPGSCRRTSGGSAAGRRGRKLPLV